MIRILIVDDQHLVRQGLQALLESRSQLKVVGTAEDGESAIEQIKVFQPDVVLIDIEMPGIDGITSTQKICQRFPETKVIVISSHENKEYVRQALQAGAEGYLLKSTLAENLEKAIWSVYQGNLQIESKLLKKVIVESFLDFADVSEQNRFTSVAQQSLKLKVNADNSTTVSNTNHVPQPKTVENTQNTRNVLLAKSTPRLKPVVEPQEFEADKLQLDKPELQNKISVTNFRSRLNSKLSIVSVLIMAVSLIYFFNNASSQPTSDLAIPKKVNVLPVNTTEVEPVDSYSTTQTYTGEVTALRTSEVGFERGGKLTEVLVEEGDRVSQGTPLAKLDTSNLQAQRQGLIAQKEQAQAVLAELENGARSEQIAAAEANVRDLQQQLELEKLKSSRRQYLYGEGAIAREELDEIDFNQKALSERLANAESNLDELQNGTRIEQITAQQAVVDRLTAEIKDLEITIAKSTLESPFNAIVSTRNLDEGTVVEPGSSIVRLVEDSSPEVKIGIPIAIASRMQLGSQQQVTIGGQEYDATVSSILPEVNTATRTRTVVLKLSSTAATEVSPQQIARLKVSQTNNTDGYWLPITALVKGDRGLWSCYALVSEDGESKAERRYLELLETQGDRVLVRGTIQLGDEIITDGTHRLVPGQLVKVNLG